MAVNIRKTIVLILLTISFNACNEDSHTDQSVPTRNTITISGIAIDGYISGATACLDLNINGACDSDEPTTTTAIDGTFSFVDVEVQNNLLIPVIVTGGIDIATNKSFVGKMSNIVNITNAKQGDSFFVTPLTDLIALSFIASADKTSTVLEGIKTNVATAFGLSIDKIEADPMKDKELFAKAQEVQQTKELILTSAAKASNVTVGTTESDELAKSIRETMASSIQENSTLDTAIAIAKLEETKVEVTIPDNEKTFISEQVKEIEKSLEVIVNETTVSTDNLNQQQSNLEDIVEVASTNIEKATEQSDIDVINSDEIAMQAYANLLKQEIQDTLPDERGHVVFILPATNSGISVDVNTPTGISPVVSNSRVTFDLTPQQRQEDINITIELSLNSESITESVTFDALGNNEVDYVYDAVAPLSNVTESKQSIMINGRYYTLIPYSFISLEQNEATLNGIEISGSLRGKNFSSLQIAQNYAGTKTLVKVYEGKTTFDSETEVAKTEITLLALNQVNVGNIEVTRVDDYRPIAPKDTNIEMPPVAPQF